MINRANFPQAEGILSKSFISFLSLKEFIIHIIDHDTIHIHTIDIYCEYEKDMSFFILSILIDLQHGS